MPNNSTIKIEGLPRDNSKYVITSYDGVLKNHSFATDISIIKVTLALIDGNRLKKHFATGLIALAELSVVRIGTIWQNQSQLDGYWTQYKDYAENINLSFDLEKNPAKCVKYKKNKDSTLLELIELEDSDILKFDNKFYGSSFTEFKRDDGIKFIVPALELFMSTYLPRNKLIRNELLLHSMDTVLQNYVNDSQCSEGTYQIAIDKQLEAETSTFLAYIACNKHARSIVSKIWGGLEGSKPSSIKDICILPYHPKKISFNASGVWLNEKTFYIQRIYKSKAPNEIRIRPISKKNVLSPTAVNEYNVNTDPTDKIALNNTIVDTKTKVSHKKNPSRHAGVKYIVSEVFPDNTELNIEPIEEIDNIVDSRNSYSTENNNVESASSGKLKGGEDSENIARTKYIIDKYPDRLPLIDEVAVALHELMKEKDSKVENLVYIDDYGIEHNNLLYTSFSNDHINLNDNKFWASGYVKNSGIKKSKSGFRKLLIVKITIDKMKPIYLLEIVRKVKSDSFYGLLFQLPSNLDYPMLEDIKYVLASNKGHFTGQNIIVFPIKNAIRMKHKWGSMKQRLNNVFKIVKQRKLFQ